MTQPFDPSASHTGHAMLDRNGEHIGSVVDVVPDPTTLEVKWFVVDPGALKSAHYVPVTGALQTEAGDVVVPYDADTVRHGPKAHRDHIITAELEHEINEHYGRAV